MIDQATRFPKSAFVEKARAAGREDYARQIEAMTEAEFVTLLRNILKAAGRA